MRKLMLALATTAALTAATAANAAITIGSTGTTAGTTLTMGAVDNTGFPETVAFSTQTDNAGSYTSYFDFTNTLSGFYNFSLITSTLNGTVTLEQLLTSGGSTVLQTSTGSGNALSLTTGVLDPNTTYRFSYTGSFPTGGGRVSGNASFYAAAVPEPAAWGLMLLGFGGMGMVLRRRRRPGLAQIA